LSYIPAVIPMIGRVSEECQTVVMVVKPL